jgi:hypothetical protein
MFTASVRARSAEDSAAHRPFAFPTTPVAGFPSCRRYLAQWRTAESPAGTDAVGARGRPARSLSDLGGLAVACRVARAIQPTRVLSMRRAVARVRDRPGRECISRRSMARSDRHRLLGSIFAPESIPVRALPVEGRSERPDRGRRPRSSRAVSCWTLTLPRPAGSRKRHPALAARCAPENAVATGSGYSLRGHGGCCACMPMLPS